MIKCLPLEFSGVSDRIPRKNTDGIYRSGGGGGGILNKVKYGEAPLRGPAPCPFIYHFGRKGTPFI